jgi:putative ABC transport system substrate-binding protein
MRRRDFIKVIGGTAVAWPLSAHAQQERGRVAHIAYLGALSLSTLDPRQIEQFKVGLAENGLIEGQNIAVDYLWAEGSTERMQRLAAELAQRDLDVIVTAGPQPVRALRAANVKAPIVFAILGDPLGDGFVDSLARPGRNITGLSMANAHLESKRLEILRDAVPSIKRVAILDDATMTRSGLADAQAGAKMLGLEALIFAVSDPGGFEGVFTEIAKQQADAVAGTASPLLNFHHRPLIALTNARRLPSIWEASGYVRDGGLLSYGPSFPDMYRQAAGYVAKILNGAKASELPVQQPIKFEFVINLKTAKTLGLDVPPALLARADEVIE